jgi:aspartyl-tRNA(Asn)/glutamyl-tRNA(Gln) amidotransferase subunit B
MKSLEEVLRDWEAVIGLEVHAELTTLKTKMFCACPIEFGAPVNTHVCPVCLGLPGALPVPNRAAIESIVLAGLATNCDIEKRSMFYRKNYMYPDMSKNFQTTQGPIAFCMRGRVDLDVVGAGAEERADMMACAVGDTRAHSRRTEEGYEISVGITRIHLEEDAAKLVHVGGTDGRITGAAYSKIDYNRCGTPLIELVTEPDLRTPQEARLLMQRLREIYRTIGISDCSMEEGSLRCDGNVSLRRRGEQTLGTKTELKNMNSFKNLHDGLAYEIRRQAEVLEAGGVIQQETRHWEPTAKRTVCMRVKETADDYRLFPEPDLAPYDLSDEFIERVRAKLPELPDAKKRRFMADYGLSRADADTLSGDSGMAAFFDEALADTDNTRARLVANLLINDVAAYLNAHSCTLTEIVLTPCSLTALASFIADGTISSKQGKDVFACMLETGESPEIIIEKKGLRQVSDIGAIIAAIDTVLAANPEKVAEYRSGKTGLIGFFVGQTMKAMEGQGNPKLINETLTAKLAE